MASIPDDRATPPRTNGPAAPSAAIGSLRGFGGRSLGGLRYVYHPAGHGAHGAIALELTAEGPGGAPRFVRAELKVGEIDRLGETDRAILGKLLDDRESRFRFESATRFAAADPTAAVPEFLPLTAGGADALLRETARTGRLFLAPGFSPNPGRAAFEPLSFDDGTSFHPRLLVRRDDATSGYRAEAVLFRDDERILAADLAYKDEHGRILAHGRIGRAAIGVLMKHSRAALSATGVVAAAAEGEALLAKLLALPGAIPLDLPPELAVDEVLRAPQPVLVITDPGVPKGVKDPEKILLSGDASFDYDGRSAPFRDATTPVFDAAKRLRYRRDAAAEESRRSELSRLPLEPAFGAGAYEFRRSELLRVVLELAEKGWRVEAKGVRYRAAGRLRLRVAASGVDWFDLRGGLDFDGAIVELPELLAAIKDDRRTVTLADGSTGVLPEEVLARLRKLRLFGTSGADGLRFGRSQAALLDELLAAADSSGEVERDPVFERLRGALGRFRQDVAAEPPASFRGSLRPYQAVGLGRLALWDELAIGGCLADDMGLGKTVQVLAHLAGRRGRGLSLVVAPRSLLFNWREEAARFAPELAVVLHADQDRPTDASSFAAATKGADLVLTTYGLVRRDAPWMKDVVFDYVVLDEAQAIKNADADASKAVRLLRSARRLALSGTPVENRMSELWSLFEFLNPGMLGSARAFDALYGKQAGPEAWGAVGRAIRPFLLRRTKEDAAPDLPEKVEQVLSCVLEGDERRRYDELRDHYRGALGGALDDGESRASFDALAALLRLRQAACHPGLLDPEARGLGSAKLETLVAALRDVEAGGHKALVFSQFTSFLDLVEERLKAEGFGCERLDGATRDREARVASFKSDPRKSVFLLSLKAGGVGLNLTEASYVFLLDPWWNPAAEAQAADRAHRFGQTRRVFTYRLVAEDTVEARVLALQDSKRSLVDAVIGQAGATSGPAPTLADLRLLLA